MKKIFVLAVTTLLLSSVTFAEGGKKCGKKNCKKPGCEKVSKADCKKASKSCCKKMAKM